MDRVLEIMKDAAFSPIKDPVISMGGLIGGEARKLCEFHDLGKSLCGNVLGKGITYAMATLETNASMGLIVASPTAGSAGIVPGMIQNSYIHQFKRVFRFLGYIQSEVDSYLANDEMTLPEDYRITRLLCPIPLKNCNDSDHG